MSYDVIDDPDILYDSDFVKEINDDLELAVQLLTRVRKECGWLGSGVSWNSFNDRAIDAFLEERS